VQELIVDSFAGGGGASTGIEMALGRSPDYAINHDREALALHAANHPDTIHLSENIYKVDPMDVVGRRPVGLLWASPDCKHFSKAKGGAPVKRNIRDLAWTVVLWAERAKPRVIILENVEEFQGWGPLIENAKGELMPCPDRRGRDFQGLGRGAQEARLRGRVARASGLRLRRTDDAQAPVRHRPAGRPPHHLADGDACRTGQGCAAAAVPHRRVRCHRLVDSVPVDLR
jgi:DNA (cytosine-5)-methyltransferase 1